MKYTSLKRHDIYTTEGHPNANLTPFPQIVIIWQQANLSGFGTKILDCEHCVVTYH